MKKLQNLLSAAFATVAGLCFFGGIVILSGGRA